MDEFLLGISLIVILSIVARLIAVYVRVPAIVPLLIPSGAILVGLVLLGHDLGTALVLLAIRDRPRGDEAGFSREFGTEGSDEGAAMVAPAPERPGRAR